MDDPAATLDVPQTLEDFLTWSGDGTARRYQFVDGEVQAMSPASATHGMIQIALGSIIRNHLIRTGSPYRVIGDVAVRPRLHAGMNIRIPDLGVTCGRIEPDQVVVEDPVLLVEILSPSNKAKTWTNVWAFSTIPSVQEILIIHATKAAGQLLRRSADGTWPDSPADIAEGGVLRLDTIDLTCPLCDLYTDTHLRRT